METWKSPETVPGELPLGCVLAKTRLVQAVVNRCDDLINKMSVAGAGTGADNTCALHGEGISKEKREKTEVCEGGTRWVLSIKAVVSYHSYDIL